MRAVVEEEYEYAGTYVGVERFRLVPCGMVEFVALNRISVRPDVGSFPVSRTGDAGGFVIIILVIILVIFFAVAAQQIRQDESGRAFAASEATFPVREVHAVCDSGCSAAGHNGGAG